MTTSLRRRVSAFADEAHPEVLNQIRALKQACISNIDLRNVGQGQDGPVNIVDVDTAYAEVIAAGLKGSGIKVNMFGSPIGKIDIEEDLQIDVDRLNRLADLADLFDCRRVRIFSYYNRTGFPAAKWRAEALRRIGALAVLAEERNLVLFHENESGVFGSTLANVLEIHREISRSRFTSHFKLIFDAANFNQEGCVPWHAWLALRDCVEALHIKENMWVKTGIYHTPAGEGDCQTPMILEDANDRGFDGSVTLEPHLVLSEEVIATGATGSANPKFVGKSSEECFQIAAEALCRIIKKVEA